jgi:hypothetical protein
MPDDSAKEIEAIVSRAISGLVPAAVRDAIAAWRFAPRCEQRVCPSSGGVQLGRLWVFARRPGDNVCLAYSDEGYGALGICWGLVFEASDKYGSSGNWYTSLQELVDDCGYF